MCHNPNQSLQKDNLHQPTNPRDTQNRSLVQVASELGVMRSKVKS